MAWVALYITERLTSRSLSQPAAASGLWRTRDPSPEGMLLRMAERSSGLLRLRRSTRAVRSRRPLAVPSLKSITVWPSWSRSPEFSGA